MQLLVLYLIGLLSIIHGFHFSNAPDTDDLCVAKIRSCDWYWQSFSLCKEVNIGMFATIESLKRACKDQAPYIKCMARAEKFCVQADILHSTEEMIRNRRFSADVCRPFSSWQQLYLNEANCLNTYSKMDLVYCIEKFIGINNLKPKNTEACKLGRAIIDCSATRVQEKCGYYGGIIFKKFLKFHSLSFYDCKDFNAEVEDDSPTSTLENLTEVIFDILEDEDFDNEAILEKDNMKNMDFRETKLDGKQVFPDNSLSEGTVSIIHFDDKSVLKMENSLSNSCPLVSQQNPITIIPTKSRYPALPDYHYVHKNKTIFALYEDLEIDVRYIGCGEADIFWIILSPLRNKYCSLTDLQSEYSEVTFKCTVHIDAACSPELNKEDINKNAEVFYRRHVASVLTPPNNQRSENMAIMNVHYLKIYPSSMYLPEKDVNLWTAEVNKHAIKQTEYVTRKGSLELEDHNDILSQHGNGSGQKRNTVTRTSPYYSDDEYYEYENWVYDHLDDEDIYFPELQRNDIIYIEDDKGELMSLHDPRSPIYSNYLYQPHSLFRPRIGAMPAYCPEESRLSISDGLKLGIKDGIYMETGSKTIEPLKGIDLKKLQEILSPIISDANIIQGRFNSKKLYTVKPSSKIGLLKSTDSNHLEEHQKDEFATDRSTYLTAEEIHDNIDIKNYPKYLDSDGTWTLTSTPYSEDSKADSMELFTEFNDYKFTQFPNKYVPKSTDAEIKLKSINQKAESEPDKESIWEIYLMKIFKKVSKTLFKKLEKSFKWKLMDKAFIDLLEVFEPSLLS